MIKITGKNVDLGDSLSNFIKESLENTNNKYFDESLSCQVAIHKEHHAFLTELNVHVSKKLTVHCRGENDDPYQSFNQALERLNNKLKRYKERLRNHKKHKDSNPNFTGNDFSPYTKFMVDHSHEDDQSKDTPMVIIEDNNGIIDTLSVSEAVMKLDLSNNEVLLFKNPAHEQLNVVYRRKDGNIGWVAPIKAQ